MLEARQLGNHVIMQKKHKKLEMWGRAQREATGVVRPTGDTIYGKVGLKFRS